jgi:anti-sigma factor RsiW
LSSPPELLAADDHLAECAACRARAAGAEELRAAFTAMSGELEADGGETEHLSYEQVAAYVNQELSPDEREIAAAHVEACDGCAEEVRDLLAFRATIPPQTPPRPEPVGAPAARDESALFPRWPALRAFFRPATLALALLLLVVISALLIVSRRSVRRDGGEVANYNNPQTEVTPPARAAESPTPVVIEQASKGNDNPPTNINATPVPVISDPRATDNVERGDRIVAVLNDAGGYVTLDRRGHIAGLPAVTPASEQALRTALSTGRAPTPGSIGELVGRPGSLLSGSSQGTPFKLASPVGTVIRKERPTLEWQPLDGADSYTVTISDSELNAVVTSPPLKDTRWTLPRPLARGGTYIWQVTAMRAGEALTVPAPPAPEARFKVLSQSGLEELSAAETSDSSSHLLRGVLYARAGLLDEAEREFQALQQKNPRSPLARKLLRNLRQLRRGASPSAR